MSGLFKPSVTIPGTTGHDAGIIGHDQRNTQRLIVLCAYEAGTDVDHANMLYLESLRHGMHRVDAWERSIRFLLKETAGDDIAPPEKEGPWRELERLALQLVEHAQQQAGKVFQPKLGGSARLMLALNHRTVDGIDLIIQDPQWIRQFTPHLNKKFETGLECSAEKPWSLKLEYEQGKIRFLVAFSLLGLPDEKSDETPFILEPIAEVLAKKLFYRGWALTPRDLFDWWAVESTLPEAVPHAELGRLLSTNSTEIKRALDAMAQSRQARSAWAAIEAPNKPQLLSTVAWANEMLDQYAAMYQHAIQHPGESTYAGAGDLPQFKMRPDLHGPQDYQSLLMHLAAVRMLKEDPSLAARSLDTLARWDATMTHHSKPLRDRWVQIINEKDWALATAERVNEIATPCVMNLLCRVVLFQSASFALAVG